MRSRKSYADAGRLGAIKRWENKPSSKDVFWSNVGVAIDRDACWPWLRNVNKKTGYGKVKFEGRDQSAHRVAYVLEKGSIPTGVFVLHKCDNRACCNPGHLFLGTHQDNMDDMKSKGRHRGPFPISV